MEIRLALRSLVRRLGLSTAVVSALGLAVALNSALFSILDGVLLRPLPFRDPEQLVVIGFRQDGNRPNELGYLPAFAQRRDALRETLEASPLVGIASQAGFNAAFFGEGARELGLQVAGVDSRFFRLLGLTPILGTDFGLEDERSPAARSRGSDVPLAIIIGYELWLRLYGADRAVLGTRELAGRRVRIVGVMGPGVKFPGETNVWAPVSSVRNRPPTYARLSTRATVGQLAKAVPDLEITPLQEAARPGGVEALVVLSAAATVLLLVTWVQVAALMFSGTMQCLPEIGVRLALGAGSRRISRQFALENAIVAIAALGIGWVGVQPLTVFITTMLPAELTHGQYLTPDPRTFAFASTLSLVGLILLSSVPGAIIRRASVLRLLSGHLPGTRFRLDRARHIMLLGQMALTGMLVYLCGLAAHSYLRALRFDYGFDAKNVLLFTPPPWAHAGTTPVQARSDYAEHTRKVAESVEGLQGSTAVVAAATLFAGPLGVGLRTDPVRITHFDGRPLNGVRAHANPVGRDFVRTLGATIIAGHTFADPEYSGQTAVAIVNQTLALRLAPAMRVMGQDLTVNVVGREMRTQYFRGPIVGVIKDLVDVTPAVPPDPQFFVPNPGTSAGSEVAIRVAPSVAAALPAVRGVLERIWGRLSPRQTRLMSDELSRVLLPYRGQSALLALIAAFCLPIAAIGLAGALAYSVRVRTRELAIRIAIGADPIAVRRGVVWQSLVVTGLGIVLGTGLGVLVGALIANQLFQVLPFDLPTAAGVTVALLGVGWIAAFVPARQASRVEPAAALRQI
jgi:predicted permease